MGQLQHRLAVVCTGSIYTGASAVGAVFPTTTQLLNCAAHAFLCPAMSHVAQATRHAELEAIDRILADHGGDAAKADFGR